MLNEDFAPGFADPVRHAQTAFRAILDALANPGTIRPLGIAPAQGPLDAGLASVLLTMADHDTSVWLAPALDRPEIARFIGFHTGAPRVDDPACAMFAFAPADQLPRLDRFNLGTQDYPDRSATIVCAMPGLTGGEPLTLRGPGIETSIVITPRGLPPDFVGQWQQNLGHFPRGVDLLLVADGAVLGLPRTSRIVEG